MLNLIWIGVGILYICWLLGFSVDFGGGLSHPLLVVAAFGAVYNLFVGRRI